MSPWKCVSRKSQNFEVYCRNDRQNNNMLSPEIIFHRLPKSLIWTWLQPCVMPDFSITFCSWASMLLDDDLLCVHHGCNFGRVCCMLQAHMQAAICPAISMIQQLKTGPMHHSELVGRHMKFVHFLLFHSYICLLYQVVAHRASCGNSWGCADACQASNLPASSFCFREDFRGSKNKTKLEFHCF